MTITSKRFKPLFYIIGILMLTSILSSCSSWFQPQTKTIEYDEEVKLHNGEMIWVHITRHYGLVGGVPSGHGKSYMPGAVEISWDTGFEGVGRKSVFFGSYVGIIDKYNDKWIVAGNKTNSTKSSINDSANCDSVGLFLERIRCVVTVNSQGKFIETHINELKNINMTNIIYPKDIEGWGLVPTVLDGQKITWEQKVALKNERYKLFKEL